MHTSGRANSLDIGQCPPNGSSIFPKHPHNLSSSCAVSEEEMMTGNVSCSPKNTYFKWLGNGVSSSEGGWITEGSNLLVEMGIEIRLGDLPICLGFDSRATNHFHQFFLNRHGKMFLIVAVCMPKC
ncbi:hypothetical protein ACFX2A_000174 [Malus domestica]